MVVGSLVGRDMTGSPDGCQIEWYIKMERFSEGGIPPLNTALRMVGRLMLGNAESPVPGRFPHAA